MPISMQNRRVLLLPTSIAAAAALVSACSLQPVYQRPEAPVAPHYPTGAVYRQPGASAPEGTARSAEGRAAADIGWRDIFTDPRLQAVIALALRNNRDLRVAMLNVESARAQYQVTRAGLFPTVGADASATRQRTPANLSRTGQASTATVYSVGADISWEIDFFGRVRSLKDEALATYFGQAETRKAAEIALVAQVATQYLAMLGDEDQIAVTQGTLKTAQESLRITRLSFDNGVGTELDVQQAQGVVEQASASLEAYQRARAQDENALVLLVGQPLPDDLPAGRPLAAQDLLTDIPAGLPSDLLERRPDIAAAEQALKAANADIGAARAAFFPRISLTGDFGFESPSSGGLFRGAQRAWSFAPQISVPIFSGGANTANLELAQVRKRTEVANYEKAIQTAFREVSDGLAARGTWDRQIQSQLRYEATQRRRLELSDMRYKNGVDDYLAVLQAQTDLFSAQQGLVAARVSRADNLVTLYKALGGGWVEHTGDTPRAPDAGLAATQGSDPAVH